MSSMREMEAIIKNKMEICGVEKYNTWSEMVLISCD